MRNRLFSLSLACAFMLSPPLLLATESDALVEIKEQLNEFATQGVFSGAVLIAKDGKPIFQQAYGSANREKHISNTLETKFRFGSMGKMFTGVAIMQLAQSGKLKLDDSVGQYLKDYPDPDVKKVTINQLLTHTGGTGDIFGPDFGQHKSDLKELSDYVRVFGSMKLRFAPGTRHEYSNYGYILLGRIIEVVSGKSYDAYVRDNIFKVAGMKSSDNLPEGKNLSAELAIPYTNGRRPNLNQGPGSDRMQGPGPGLKQGSGPNLAQRPGSSPANVRSAEPELPYRGTSAGGGYSTVGDFLKFADALLSNRLLDSDHTKLLTTGKVNTPKPGTLYAYGFEDATTLNGVRFFGHGGGSPGTNGKLMIFPASQYLVVVLSNLDPPSADEVANFIENTLPIQ